MAPFPSNHNPRGQHGFTLIETLVSVVILTVGLVAVAALMSEMIKDTATSRDMSAASMLASEKLEDLNRFPASDPAVAVTSGTTIGSLSSDVTQSGVDYFDEVQLSVTGGAVAETTTSKDASGNTVYTTITQLPDGTISSADSAATPSLPGGAVMFKRRWIIEMNVPVTGVRRVTVLVQLMNGPTARPVTFRMSMVRP